jgi:hypothetical protein
MDENNVLLYDRYETNYYIDKKFMAYHHWSYRSDCFVYIPCNFCRNLQVNKLIRGMVYCSLSRSPYKMDCYYFKSDRTVSKEFNNFYKERKER